MPDMDPFDFLAVVNRIYGAVQGVVYNAVLAKAATRCSATVVMIGLAFGYRPTDL